MKKIANLAKSNSFKKPTPYPKNKFQKILLTEDSAKLCF